MMDIIIHDCIRSYMIIIVQEWKVRRTFPYILPGQNLSEHKNILFLI